MRASYVDVVDSPLRPGAADSRIYFREIGAGTPLVFLHGGWGYEIYPFDVQAAALQHRFRILIPDRSGYGRSSGIDALPPDFHGRAAVETLRFLDALGIERAVLWGHSDGAVIAALCGLTQPERFQGLICEAFHYQRTKHRSLEWLRSMKDAPDSLGERTKSALISDHGDNWRKVVERNASAWVSIPELPGADMYQGKLQELTVPTLFIYGGDDPRNEPGDIEMVREELPQAEIQVIEGAKHSPHSGLDSADKCAKIAAEFLARLR